MAQFGPATFVCGSHPSARPDQFPPREQVGPNRGLVERILGFSMSGIAAILQLDGSPADKTALVKINDAARHRGPDGGHTIVIGSGGLGYRHFETGHDYGCSQQPLECGELKIVLDGRIDNRTSVQAALTSTGRVRQKCSDAELIAIAYECWGTDCVNRFVGEFAFVLWDGRQRSLFCARDALGVKPLHYYVDSRLFVCASEIQQLLLHPRVQAQPNEGMLGEYLCRQVKSRTETLYRNIFRLPGGHCLSLGSTGLRVSRYWNFRGADDARRSDEDYAEEFLNLFSESIRCRTDDRCRIGLDLSGGLDSSSIACTASRLAGSRDRFEAFSLGCPEPRADERVFINAVSDQTGIKTHMFETSRVNSVRIPEIVTKYRVLPGPANLLMHDSILDSFRKNDVRIRLTGSGGDQLTIGDPKHIADMLRRFRLLAAYRQAHLDVRVLGDWGEKVSAFHVF